MRLNAGSTALLAPLLGLAALHPVCAVAACGDDPAPRVIWINCDKSGIDLSGVDLRGAILTRTNLQNANLSHALLTGAELNFANLTGANLQGASGQCPHARCGSQRRRSRRCDLNSTSNRARLHGTDFTAAELREASFYQAELNVPGCARTDAKSWLGQARADGAGSRLRISPAPTYGAVLERASLRGAVLRGAISNAPCCCRRISAAPISPRPAWSAPTSAAPISPLRRSTTRNGSTSSAAGRLQSAIP